MSCSLPNAFTALVVTILKCVCIRCSKFLIDKNSPEVQEICRSCNGKKRFTEIVERCSKSGVKICGVDCEDGKGCEAEPENDRADDEETLGPAT